MMTYILAALLVASLIANICQLSNRQSMDRWLAKYRRRIRRQDDALDRAARTLRTDKEDLLGPIATAGYADLPQHGVGHMRIGGMLCRPWWAQRRPSEED